MPEFAQFALIGFIIGAAVVLVVGLWLFDDEEPDEFDPSDGPR